MFCIFVLIQEKNFYQIYDQLKLSVIFNNVYFSIYFAKPRPEIKQNIGPKKLNKYLPTPFPSKLIINCKNIKCKHRQVRNKKQNFLFIYFNPV